LNAPAAAPNAGGALPLAFLVAFVACFFTANTVIQFSRRLPSSGLFYNFVSHGLGGGAGFFTGWLYFAAFIMFAIGLFTANGACSIGVKGVGLGAVFGILSFVGFESAAVLGEETRDARRNIPRAVFGAICVIGAFYVFMMYALAAGYHLNNPAQMQAFLNDAT